MTVKLLYFAWVREKVGKVEEIVDLPAGIATVADLVAWLKDRGPEYAEAFAPPGVVRARHRQEAHAACLPNRGRPRDRSVPAGRGRLRNVAVRVQREDFDIGAEVARLQAGRTDIGAIVTFTGTVRGGNAGARVAAMTLERYPRHDRGGAGPRRGRGGGTLAAASEPRRAPHRHAPARRQHCAGGDGLGAPARRSSPPPRSSMDYLKTRAPFWKKEAGNRRSARSAGWRRARATTPRRSGGITTKRGDGSTFAALHCASNAGAGRDHRRAGARSQDRASRG